MRSFGRLAFLARLASLAWLPAACAPQSPPPPPGAQAAAGAVSGARISLERGPCFGTCPVYRVTLDRSGSVRFEGRRFVADTGLHTRSVPGARVDSLVAALEAAGYFGFADRYGVGQPGCEPYATDLPTVTTEVHAGARDKRVEHDHGCAGAPDALGALERRIDEVAEVERWIRR